MEHHVIDFLVSLFELSQKFSIKSAYDFMIFRTLYEDVGVVSIEDIEK